jgi:hypothetical protein
MGSANITAGLLLNRQLRSGGWSYFDSQQSCVESTSLAVLALGPDGHHASIAATEHLVQSQARDGGWPACIGDPESAWVTALALCTLNTTNDLAVARERAFRWLMMERGRDGHWFWRWKFRIAEREVRFDPDKYGWPWSPGTVSWVIPSAFSLVAIKEYTVCNRFAAAENRIRLGVDMLLDRACVGRGCNSGNSVVYGIPLLPHVEATAIALLALQDEERTPVIRMSLAWLEQIRHHRGGGKSGLVHSQLVCVSRAEDLKARLATLIGDGPDIRNNATLASAILALRCGEMIHPFVVLR